MVTVMVWGTLRPDLGVGDVDGEGLGHGLAEGEVVDGIAVRACFAGILVVERVLVGAVRAEGQGAVGRSVGIDDVPGAGSSGSGHSGGGAAVGQARSCVLDVEVELVDIVLRGARPVFLVGIGSEDPAGKGSGLCWPSPFRRASWACCRRRFPRAGRRPVP